ncbi:glucose-6-phosphate isomerase [Mycoplasmoides alvi]|uniref:glucose-6-phosphate isomerase n=1 Tax=Mycoplasmoides alvi TaxID=78580 RepID=UPI00051AB6AE|nr:glucose-6-phosphate isomerase [Mycoplasmoides alvi]
MNKINISSELMKNISLSDIHKKYQKKVDKIHQSIFNKTCLGHEMLGWIDYPDQDHSSLFLEMDKIKTKWLKFGINEVVIIGIGGSYTGIKAIINFVNADKQKEKINFCFFNALSSTENINYLNSLKTKNWSIIVISKSGSTLETALNFRILREAIKKQYKNKHYERIVAITDPNVGTLHDICIKNGYKILPIFSNIGGRFSTITPVGLFPALLAGIGIKSILQGAKDAKQDLNSSDLYNNTAYLYAVYRHFLYKHLKYDVEIFMTYESNLKYLCVQHQQLFGESEGKKQDSLFPTYAICTTDLHSMGQLFQEGKQIFFETVLKVLNPNKDMKISKSTFANDDKLDYLVGKTINEVNYLISDAVMKAHKDDGINIIQIFIPDTSAYTFGYFYYWLSIATAMSASLLNHNPFNQNGVEIYKKIMFKYLGRK